MPRYGFAENIRRYAVKEIKQARSRRAAFIALQAGATRENIRQASGEKDESDTLDICQVLRTRKFAHEAGVELIDDSGGQRLDTTFRIRILYYFLSRRQRIFRLDDLPPRGKSLAEQEDRCPTARNKFLG